MAGAAIKVARPIGLEIKLRGHPVHRVDHAPELGHEERVHDAGGREGEMDRYCDGDDELIDAGQTVVGVDEEPFPVEGHDLDFEWPSLASQRPRGIKLMRTNPGNAAEKHDREE